MQSTFLGVNSKKEPQPIMVKNIPLVLISANILVHAATVETAADKDIPVNETTPVVLKDILGYLRQSVTNGMPAYAMFDDYYWHRIKVIYSVPM